MKYIATFHTHLSAMLTQRTLAKNGVEAKLTPVPRQLSSSCGTCVRYESDSPRLGDMDQDVERVVRQLVNETYETVYENPLE